MISKMPKKCKLCERQSPIDIIPAEARYQEYRPFVLWNYEKFSIRDNNLRATNTLNTLKLLPLGDTDLPTLTGGPLNVEYELAEIHFHWGEDETDNGSEHKIDGKSFPMEMHLVHKNIHDENIEEALTHENGLAVLGFKFAVVDDTKRVNPGMDTLTKLAKKHLVNPGDIAEADKLPQNQNVAVINFLPLLLDCYFYYTGSLTTGSYSEAVNWIVFKNPLAIHADNLRDFQSLMDDKGERLLNNYRPVQNRNNRPLYYHGGEFLKSGLISKGSGSTARSHGYPNAKDYMLTVPAPFLTEIAPLAKAHMSENALKAVTVVGNKSEFIAHKYLLIWYRKAMDKKKHHHACKGRDHEMEALRKELVEKDKEINNMKKESKELNLASEAEKRQDEKEKEEFKEKVNQWERKVENERKTKERIDSERDDWANDYY